MKSGQICINARMLGQYTLKFRDNDVNPFPKKKKKKIEIK